MSARIEILDTPIEGLKILRRQPSVDPRGSIERVFCRDELRALLRGKDIAQINRTVTARPGVVRGMHFQNPPYAEIKIVSCFRGEIFDVAVDIRRGSPTFLQWHAEILSAQNHRAMFIPEGFAHGFQTLSPDCELLYLHTASHAPSVEGALDACDPALAIRWPEPIAERSARDRSHPPISREFTGIPL